MVLRGVMQYDPELRFTPKGHSLCTFTILSPQGFTHCEAWESLAETIANDATRYQKGVIVEVSGHTRTRVYAGNSFVAFVVKSIERV